jgi:DNA-binding HxlR family transcriptional regulator
MKKDKDKKKKRTKREQQPDQAPEKTESETGQPEPEPAVDPLQYMISVVGGKWKLRILWALRTGTNQRYGEIKQQTSSITDMMLSQSLRELTAAGLINRRQYQQIPPKVEYHITPAGAELIPGIELFCAWAAKRMKEG